LTDLGWHLTMSGATIYSNKIHNLTGGLDLIKCKNFPQTALIFECFAQRESRLFWLNDKVVYSNTNKKSYWSNAIFEVFLIDWDFFISNLPNFYLDKNKEYAIKKHSVQTGLFSLVSFLSYRSIGIYSFQVFRKYFKQIQFNSNLNVVVLLLISIIPKGLLIFLKKIFYPKK
jgi:abequosyltransferase